MCSGTAAPDKSLIFIGAKILQMNVFIEPLPLAGTILTLPKVLK
jgi:hypothetical protein